MISSLNLNSEDVLLGQGTLRPDLIESASKMVSGKADTIKTHHNDSGLVRKLRDEGRVVEPLKDFHKDEVRIILAFINFKLQLNGRSRKLKYKLRYQFQLILFPKIKILVMNILSKYSTFERLHCS